MKHSSTTRPTGGYFATLVAGLVLLLLATASVADELIASVDRNTVSIDETLQLTVRYTGNSSASKPDFSQLRAQFNIEVSNQSNQFRNINGRITTFTEWSLTLSPLREGTLLIPSFTYEGLISDAIEITVKPAVADPRGAQEDVFVETEFSANTVYVQQQLLVTYRLFYAVNVESLDNEPLDIDNLIKEDLPVTRYTRKIADKSYNVVEFGYALFPQTSGTLDIPALRWNLKIQQGLRRSFFDSGRYLIKRLRTEAKTIQVLPPPASYPAGATWLPASALSLSENWSRPLSEFKVGEPITRTLTLSAQGLTDAQLPQFTPTANAAALKVYPDKPELTSEARADGMHAQRVESAAVVINEGGTITVPAVQVHWWDVNQQQLKTAEIPAHTVVVAGAPAKAPTPPPTAETSPVAQVAAQNQGSIDRLRAAIIGWQLLSALLALVSLGFAGLWWRARSGQQQPHPLGTPAKSGAQAALRALHKACKEGQPAAIRETLLRWAALAWPENPPTTLAQLAALYRSQALHDALNALDAQLYGSAGNHAFNGEALWSALESCRKARATNAASEGLTPFYPA